MSSCFSPQVKVMHKQLLLFHNAISAYFAGNQQQLEQTLKQFNIKLRPPGADKPSWLEEQWAALLGLLQLLSQPPPPVTCWNPQLKEDHYREKNTDHLVEEDVKSGWMIGLVYHRVWMINGLNATGNQVASFMNIQGAFSASLPDFLSPL